MLIYYILYFHMSFYLILYITVAVNLFIIWWLYYSKNKWKIESLFFILSIIFIFLWIITYLMFFLDQTSKNVLLNMSRFMYSIALLSMYMMLFFVIYYNVKNYNKNIVRLIIWTFFWLALVWIFSNFLIEDMLYDENYKIFYEKYWIFYNFYAIMYGSFIPIFLCAIYFKLKKINYLKKVRLKIISSGFLTFMWLEIIFLSILPIFDIRWFVKEHVLFFIPFIISMWYSIHKYNFLDINVIIWKVINFFFSLLSSLLVVSILRWYLWNSVDEKLEVFWWIKQDFWVIDLTLWIIIFLFVNKLFKDYILWSDEYVFLAKKVSKLKRKIVFISTFNWLNNTLKIELTNILKIYYVDIKLTNSNNLKWIKDFFTRDYSNNLFINDIVFIEENKNKFNYKLIKTEISKDSNLVFPLLDNKWDLIWIFEIWNKIFQDNYTKEEIDILKDFSEFLVWHIRYLEIYSKIQELNLNLDQKVDEKTIQYNILLNKQNDFISMASHEIKSPLWSCIFQLDCLIDDLKNWDLENENLIKELETLNNQLVKVWNLTKKIFSLQKYDLEKIELYKQEIEINYLFEDKIDFYKKVNPQVEFIKEINSDIWDVNIDKIQFEQVIDNLVNNAIKFCDKLNPKILIKAFKENESLFIEIEDNWEWFSWIDQDSIFDKYSTWEKTSVWIWLWLFLCKKIVELHSWSIKAMNWDFLYWAKFVIILPTK